MELTMRLLVSPVVLFAALLAVPTIQALEGFPSSLSTSLTGFGNGRRSSSREEDLMNALQFLEEYERNLGDTRVGVEEDDWSPREAFPYLERNDPDEDIVPYGIWKDEEEEPIVGGNTEEFKIFLQSLLQGANRNDVISSRYYTPQMSSFNNNQDVLFSPVDPDLEDEIELDVAIEKLKVKQKEERLWEDIIGDMIAEEILEADAREDIKELIDAEEEEAQLDDVLEEDTIFEEAPWSEDESFEAGESDVVPLSWAEPKWENDEESSMGDEFDTESLTPAEEDEVEREAAILLLEEILAEAEEKQRQEEEQQEMLEMVLGDDSSFEDEEDEDTLDESTEEAIENYFRALLENNADEQIIFDDDEDEIVLGTSSQENDEESEQASSEFNILDQLSSVPEEDTGEIIQEFELSEEEEPEDGNIDYNLLLRDLTNEIQAAANEVEEEMVEALKDRIEENNMRYFEEDEEFEEDATNDASNEINEVDAANILAEMFYQQQEKRSRGLGTCPIEKLVDDCAFINEFPDVDPYHIYRSTFKRACNRHQLCYTCGANYEIEASLCDEVFDAEMLAECGEEDECIGAADQFLFIATNTHIRMPQPPTECQARCLLDYLIKD